MRGSVDPYGERSGDGGSLNGAAERVHRFIDALKLSGYGSVLVVTDSFITKAIFGYLENRLLVEAMEFDLLQGTYIEFEI